MEESDVRKIFGRRLKQIMIERGKRQKDFAKELGITEKTLSSYVQGHSIPTLISLVQMASALNVTTDFLLGLSYNISPVEKEEDAIGNDILLIRRSYHSMPEHQRQAVLQLVTSIVDKKVE